MRYKLRAMNALERLVKQGFANVQSGLVAEWVCNLANDADINIKCRLSLLPSGGWDFELES